MTAKEAKHFLKEFLGDKPNFREERPGQDEKVYRQMDMLAEAIDLAISALEAQNAVMHIDLPEISKDDVVKMIKTATNQFVSGTDAKKMIFAVKRKGVQNEDR